MKQFTLLNDIHFDVIAALIENNRPGKYWDDLKRKLQAEGRDIKQAPGRF